MTETQHTNDLAPIIVLATISALGMLIVLFPAETQTVTAFLAPAWDFVANGVRSIWNLVVGGL